MNTLYNLGIKLYKSVASLVAMRSDKVQLMVKGQKEAFDKMRNSISDSDNYIWIHVSSLGEFEQGRPLIEKIKRKQPDYKILLTFFSPSGYEVRKDYKYADVICYLPFDTPANARKFIELAHPKMAIFVKYEFWGNYLEQLRIHAVPTYLISSIFRPTQIFFKWYGGMFRSMLSTFATLYVQDDNSKQLLSQININNVIVAGDTRFDRVTDILNSTKDIPDVKKFIDGKFVLIAGSSWPHDEQIFIDYFNTHSNIKLIIAPHQIHQSHIEDIESRLKRKFILYSDLNSENATSVDCLIINNFGLLSSLYRYASVAYIGGGFGAGIHNINEAAVYGAPIIFGPNHHKFKEATDLIALGGATEISNNTDFGTLMDSYLSNNGLLQSAGKIAGDYIKSNLGVTDRIYDDLFTK